MVVKVKKMSLVMMKSWALAGFVFLHDEAFNGCIFGLDVGPYLIAARRFHGIGRSFNV